MSEGHIAVAPPRKTLFVVLLGGLVVASAILVGAVLPAEYHIDPLGIGKATGLMQLSRPAEVEVTLPTSAKTAVAHSYTAEFRTDTVEIPLAGAGDADHRDQLEWKVRMQTGDTLVYSWRVAAPEDQFYADFHGQTDPTPEVQVLTYKKGTMVADNGSVVAQFDGIHGWYLQNQSEQPVTVQLRLAGFYQMRPDPFASE